MPELGETRTRYMHDPLGDPNRKLRLHDRFIKTYGVNPPVWFTYKVAEVLPSEVPEGALEPELR
jgi:hypothetical protein